MQVPAFPFSSKQRPLQIAASPAEVGRSLLGQVIPRTIRGRIAKRHDVLAPLPLIICLALGEAYLFVFPVLDGSWWRVLYLDAFGAIWSAALFWRNHWARVSDSMRREYEFVREHLLPALHYSGALPSTADALRLMKGEVVAMPHNTNLYHANSMRLIREADGTHSIQFEFN